MFKIVLSCITFSFIFLSSAPAFSAIVEKENRLYRDKNEGRAGAIDRVICVDGLKLFQTIGPAYGVNSSNAVSTIQLYEATKRGKVVPATCDK